MLSQQTKNLPRAQCARTLPQWRIRLTMLGYTFIIFHYTPTGSSHCFGYVWFTFIFYNVIKGSMWHAIPNRRISFAVPISNICFIYKIPSFNRFCEYFYGTSRFHVLKQEDSLLALYS